MITLFSPIYSYLFRLTERPVSALISKNQGNRMYLSKYIYIFKQLTIIFFSQIVPHDLSSGCFSNRRRPCHVELSADDICKWTQIYPMSIQGIPLIGGTLQTGFGHLGQGRFLLKQSRGKFLFNLNTMKANRKDNEKFQNFHFL